MSPKKDDPTDIEQLRKQCIALTDQMSDVDQENEDLRRALKRANTSHDAVFKAHGELRKENERLKGLLKEKGEEIEKAWAHEQTVNQEWGDRHAQLKEESQKFADERQRLLHTLDTRHFEVVQCQDRLAEAHRIIEASEDAHKVMAMEKRVEYLEERLESYHDALERVREISGRGYGW